MVSTRRQTQGLQGLQTGESLALRSRTTPGASSTEIAELTDESEQQPEKKARMTGVVIPQNQAPLQIRGTESSGPEVLDSQSPLNVEASREGSEVSVTKVQDIRDESALHAKTASVDSKSDIDKVGDSQLVDVIRDTPGHHLRFGEDTDAEPVVTSSITFGRSGGAEESEHLTSEESDEEAPPELATTARPLGQRTLVPPSSRRPKRKISSKFNGGENLPSQTNDQTMPKYLDGPDHTKSSARNELSAPSESRSPLSNVSTLVASKAPIPPKNKRNKDFVKNGIVYRFQPTQESISGKLPSKQNPNSRKSKESLLKRKRSAPTMKPKFIRT
ncbi:MAG: hypothetical protein Q9160_008875 [Pyrenula sp. 1 TL-2023]